MKYLRYINNEKIYDIPIANDYVALLNKLVTSKDITYKTKTIIKDVKIIVPNKVVEMTFLDGKKEKSVCREPDTFSLETAISICISKYIMGGSGAYNNAVKQGMKVYEESLKKKALAKAEEERIKRKKIKRAEYKKRRAERKQAEEKERQIEIQKEAYIRAHNELEKSYNDTNIVQIRETNY